MEITYLGHAGLFIETQDCNIMCDPWKHNNPQFFDSWYVYPDNSHLKWEWYMDNVDFLYISHIHQDHCDSKFLKELIDRNKNVKIILADFRYKRLKKLLSDIGFNDFIVGQGICGSTTFVTYPSQTIDREKEDSSLLVNDNKITFLNLNDSIIEDEHKEDIIKRFDKVDMVASQFSGASWYPLAYNYDNKTLLEKCEVHRSRTFERCMGVKKDLDIEKLILTAGPPCFLDKDLIHMNFTGNNASIFPDAWQVSEFDTEDSIYRVLAGDKFNYDSVIDRKEGPDKNEFLNRNKKNHKYGEKIHYDDYVNVEVKFKNWFNEILSSCIWLRKYMPKRLYLSVNDYNSFELDFRKGQVIRIDSENFIKDDYYLIKIPSKVFYKLVTEKETDWETAWLSGRCKFERSPDLYNPWLLSFFRNLNVEQLSNIKLSLDSTKKNNSKIIIDGYEVDRYCPHQQYDLKYHSKVDSKNKTITCLGHDWSWKLDTGEGINTKCKLKCKKVNSEIMETL